MIWANNLSFSIMVEIFVTFRNFFSSCHPEWRGKMNAKKHGNLFLWLTRCYLLPFTIGYVSWTLLGTNSQRWDLHIHSRSCCFVGFFHIHLNLLRLRGSLKHAPKCISFCEKFCFSTFHVPGYNLQK